MVIDRLGDAPVLSLDNTPCLPRPARRRCLLLMVPRPWQRFRQAIAEEGAAARQQPAGRPAEPGYRLYRTLYP
jgi:hypothetical protein